jgi:hypothetical protein
MTFDEAWERVDKGERFEDPGILMLSDEDGWTIAHIQARRGWTTMDPDILSLVSRRKGTVLDVMLTYGWKPQTEEEKLVVFTVKAGSPPSESGGMPYYYEILNRVDEGEERFEDLETLKLVDKEGWTIAHWQAHYGWTTLDPDILSLVTNEGETVLDIMLAEGWEPKTEEEKLIVCTVKAGS